MKSFKTNNIDVVKSCQSFFDFSLPSDLWTRRNKKLNVTYMTCDKIFVHYGKGDRVPVAGTHYTM